MRFFALTAASIVLPWAALAGTCSCNGQTREVRDQESLSVQAAPHRDEAAEQPIDLAEAADRIVQATNRFRERKERQPVVKNDELTAAARYFAEFMAQNDKYGHTADGQRPADRAASHGYDYCIVSENIAYQYSSVGFEGQELSQAFVVGWKESPGHRKNMLDRDVTETGVAIAQSSKSNTYYAVQMFGRPRSAAIEFAITNASQQAVEYSIAGRTFPLAPRVTRTHQRCRPEDVVFLWDSADTDAGEENQDEPARTTIRPQDGDRFVVAHGDEGWSVSREQ